jgi:hypothetical protein
MTPSATDTCPRCGGVFHCGATDPAPCVCTTITLSAATLAALRQRWQGCLCLACLAQIQREAGEAGETAAAPKAR